MTPPAPQAAPRGDGACPSGARPAEARDALLARLGAHGPAPAHRERLMLFGQFVGSWEVEVTTLQPDGTWRETTAEWHFGWILEGRAVQDVWISPARTAGERAAAPVEEYGVSVRLYDPRRDGWRSVWVGPVQGVLRTFRVEERPTEIALLGEDDRGRAMRWVFSQIAPARFPERFEWRSEVEETLGAWRLVQSMRARRRSGADGGHDHRARGLPTKARS